MDREQYNHSFGLKPKLINIDYYSLRKCYIKRGHHTCKKVRRQNNTDFVVSFEICHIDAVRTHSTNNSTFYLN